jgi:hypothetical protein
VLTNALCVGLLQDLEIVEPQAAAPPALSTPKRQKQPQPKRLALEQEEDQQ